jgi:sulfur-carrier protein adenylyltransferase/sulfurtransferase
MNFEYFQRQLALESWGMLAQTALQDKSVGIVGVGGLGSWLALSLGGCGLNRILLVDGDRITTSNLHRQPLYCPKDVGKMKVEVALARCSEQFPETQWEAVPTFLTAENQLEIFSGCDLILDGTDDFSARVWIDEAAEKLGIPWVFAGIFQSEIQTGVFHPSHGRSFRQLFGETEGSEGGSCQIQGVLPPVPAMAAQMQVHVALEILGKGTDPLSYPFLHGSLTDFQFKKMHL